MISVFAGPVSNTTKHEEVEWPELYKLLMQKPAVLPDNESETKARHGAYFVRGLIDDNRDDEHLQSCCLLILDVDNPVGSKPLPTPLQTHRALKGFQHAAWNTATPGRSRIVFPVQVYDKADTDKLTWAAYHFCKQRGLYFTYAGESKTKSQPWYLPQTTDPDNHRAYGQVDGTLFSLGFISNVPAMPSSRNAGSHTEHSGNYSGDSHNPTEVFIAELQSGTIHQAAKTYAGWKVKTTNLSTRQIFDELNAIINANCPDITKVRRWFDHERRGLEAWFAGQDFSGPDDDNNDAPVANVIYKLHDYLNQQFPPPNPLIGTKHNSLLVRGEGLFEAGRSGVGKTMVATDMAIKAAAGYDVLGYPVPKPSRVLIYQAELPNTYFQLRLRNLVDAYTMGDRNRAAMALDNVFIADIQAPFNMAEKGNTAVEIVGDEASRVDADLVIVDPFLSFYTGDENINPEVRRGLDLLTYGVARPLDLGIMISDHLPKSTKGTNGELISMRGAGAKHDWSSTVLLVTGAKTPEGEHGDFIKVNVDKVRYGPKPRDPFTVRRDINTGLHSLWEGNSVDPMAVAKFLDEAGGELTTTKIQDAIQGEYELSRPVANKVIKGAIDAGYIATEKGARNAILHVITDKYVTAREEV